MSKGNLKAMVRALAKHYGLKDAENGDMTKLMNEVKSRPGNKEKTVAELYERDIEKKSTPAKTAEVRSESKQDAKTESTGGSVTTNVQVNPPELSVPVNPTITVNSPAPVIVQPMQVRPQAWQMAAIVFAWLQPFAIGILTGGVLVAVKFAPAIRIATGG